VCAKFRCALLRIKKALGIFSELIPTGRLNLQDRKMQDWKMTDKSAGLEFARLENDGQKCRAGKCRTGK